MSDALPAVVELLSYVPTLEAMPEEVRSSLATWTEALGAASWPGSRYIHPHPERPHRPPCAYVAGIRWAGERYTVAVTHRWPVRPADLQWLDGCPIPPPIVALRWVVGS